MLINKARFFSNYIDWVISGLLIFLKGNSGIFKPRPYFWEVLEIRVYPYNGREQGLDEQQHCS